MWQIQTYIEKLYECALHSLRSITSWDVDVLEIRLFFGVFFSFHFHSFEMKMHKLNKNNNTHIIINAQARTNACRFICFLLFSNDLLSSSCITWNALLSSFDSEYRRICALIQKIRLFARFFFCSIVFRSCFFLTHSLQRFSIVKWTSNKILWLEILTLVIMDCLWHRLYVYVVDGFTHFQL